jgi:hypothetical protein
MVDKKYKVEQELERFLSVPLKLKILRECYLLLFIKMANDTTDITVEKSTVHSTDGTKKSVYTVTVFD